MGIKWRTIGLEEKKKFNEIAMFNVAPAAFALHMAGFRSKLDFLASDGCQVVTWVSAVEEISEPGA